MVAASQEEDGEEEEGADGDRPSIDLSTAAPTPTAATNGHHSSLWSSESREADAAMQKAQVGTTVQGIATCLCTSAFMHLQYQSQQ